MVTSSIEDQDLVLSPSMKNSNLIFIITLALLVITLVMKIFMGTRPEKAKVYLMDFSCYKPSPSEKVTKELMLSKMRRYVSNFTNETMEFSRKMLDRSGIGPVTYGAKALLMDPPNICMVEAREETERVIFGVVDQLLAKTGVDPVKIGVVVVNCCVFNAVPSLSAMIVNRYKLGDNVLSYCLSGMGCSAGLLAVGLAKQLLQVHEDIYALIVSTENITENFYKGNDRAMLLINCLFRVGGAAILLSNRPSDRQSAKYELMHTVHTFTASSDRSYNCIFQEEDAEGIKGITITKDLLAAAFDSMKANITTLGPLILPLSEQLRFAANYFTRKLLHMDHIKPYTPNFRGRIEHFYSHVGGKPVLDEVQKNLKMSDNDMEPSRMTLYRWGNTSSSSIWYALAYGEAKGRMKKGDRVWQIAFGSGFKCQSVVWRALRDVDDKEKLNPWTEEIDEFPVDANAGSFPCYFDASH